MNFDDLRKLVRQGKKAEALAALKRMKEESRYEPTSITQEVGKPARCYRGRTRVVLDKDGKWKPAPKRRPKA